MLKLDSEESKLNASTLRPSQVHHWLRSNVDWERGKYTSAIPLEYLPPYLSTLRSTQVPLLHVQVHLGLDMDLGYMSGVGQVNIPMCSTYTYDYKGSEWEGWYETSDRLDRVSDISGPWLV